MTLEILEKAKSARPFFGLIAFLVSFPALVVNLNNSKLAEENRRYEEKNGSDAVCVKCWRKTGSGVSTI